MPTCCARNQAPAFSRQYPSYRTAGRRGRRTRRTVAPVRGTTWRPVAPAPHQRLGQLHPRHRAPITSRSSAYGHSNSTRTTPSQSASSARPSRCSEYLHSIRYNQGSGGVGRSPFLSTIRTPKNPPSLLTHNWARLSSSALPRIFEGWGFLPNTRFTASQTSRISDVASPAIITTSTRSKHVLGLGLARNVRVQQNLTYAQKVSRLQARPNWTVPPIQV